MKSTARVSTDNISVVQAEGQVNDVKYDALFGRLKEALEEKKSLQLRAETAEETVAEYKRELSMKTKEIVNLNEIIEINFSNDEEVDRIIAENVNTLQAKTNRFLSENGSLKSELKKAATEIAELKEELAKTKAENKLEVERVKTGEIAREQMFQTQLVTARDATAAARKANHESIESKSDLERTLLELKEVYGKLEKAKAENDATKSALAKSQAEVTENELFFSNAILLNLLTRLTQLLLF